MSGLKNSLYLLSGYSSGVCIVLIMLIILAQVIGRLFSFIVPSAEDFSGYLLAASTFFGLAYSFKEGGHIRVNILLQRLPASVQLFHEVFLLFVALFIAAFMGFYCAHMVWESYLFEEITHGYIPIPLWVPQLPVALGLVGLNLAIIDNLILALSGKEPIYKIREREVD